MAEGGVMEQAPANLSDFIVAEVHRQTNEDAIRAQVEKKIGETVKSAVDSAFRSYGNVGQQIEKVVAEALQIGDRLDVPRYGNMVMAVLRAKMDEVLGELVNKRLSEEMAEILSIAPKEVKLSAVVEKMIKDIDQHDRYGTHVTCIIEESTSVSGFHSVYLDEDEKSDREKYSCECRLQIDREGKIFALTIGGKDCKTAIQMGAYHGWEKMIFAAYCCGSKFIIDGEPSTGIGDF